MNRCIRILIVACVASGCRGGGASSAPIVEPDAAASLLPDATTDNGNTSAPDSAAHEAGATDAHLATPDSEAIGAACAPDDGVADPPCPGGEQLRCNGKCFTKPGQCKAGCLMVAAARNTRNVLFENGLAYHYNSSLVSVTDLATHVETPVATAVHDGFFVVGVKNGTVYWDDGGSIYKATPGGAAVSWVKKPTTLSQSIAFTDDKLFLSGGDTTLYSVPLTGDPILTTVSTKVYDIGYDETSLYVVGAIGPGVSPATYRVAGGDLTRATFITGELMDVSGRLYGDYLYELNMTGAQRVAKTGGPAQPFFSPPAQIRSTVAAHDALYMLDDQGQVQRVRSAQDITRIARADPTQTSVIVTDGQSVYLATGRNTDGGLFRILEAP